MSVTVGTAASLNAALAARPPGAPDGSPFRSLARRIDAGRYVTPATVLLATALAVLGLFVLAPVLLLLTRTLTDDAGRWVGIGNLLRYLGGTGLATSAWNTFLLGASASLIATALAFAYAWSLSHTRLPFRGLFRAIALLPIYAPTMLFAIGLIYLLGRQGLLTLGAFGALPFRFSIELYGPIGIVLAHALVIFPAAFLMLHGPLSTIDGRLHEAAQSMGTSPARAFAAITLPACRFALCGALAVGFALAITDFGVPKVVGGRTAVLSVDIYQQVVGQHDLSMGATVSVVLLAASAAAFAIDRLTRRRQAAASVTSKWTPYVPRPNRVRDSIALVYCAVVAGVILIVAAVPIFVTFVDLWPYSLSGDGASERSVFSLRHVRFAALGGAGGDGAAAFRNSLWVAALTAVVGTAFTFVTAYLVEKTRATTPGWMRRGAYGLAVAPVGIPGLALGLALVLMISAPSIGPASNPLRALYATTALLVVCNVVHFIGVSFLTAVAALRQLDAEFESAAASLGVPQWRLFLRVTLPLCAPAVLEIAMYFFVSAMTTVSAVIFLYSPDTPLASVAVVNLDDAGQTQAAAAVCALIFVTNLVVRAGVTGMSAGLRAALAPRAAGTPLTDRAASGTDTHAQPI